MKVNDRRYDGMGNGNQLTKDYAKSSINIPAHGHAKWGFEVEISGDELALIRAGEVEAA